MTQLAGPPSASPRAARAGVLAACAVIVAVAAAAYHGTFRAPFIFDDSINIVDNTAIRSLWPPRWAVGASRPVALFTFALNYAASGYDVAGWHAVNLAIHALAGLVLFDLVRRTLELPALADRFRGRSAWVAFAAATIWVAHPLHTSAVTYVVHRFESLAGLFYLLTLDLFAHSVTAKRPLGWRVATFVACLLGIATKEIVVTAPVVVLLYDRCFVAASVREAVRRRGAVHAALFAIWIVLASLVMFAPRNASQGFGFVDLGPRDYARSSIGAVVYYLRLTLWPRDLSIDYFDWPVARSLREVAGSAAILGAIVLASAWALRAAPPLAFVGLAWLVVLAPTSSFLPLKGEIVAERRMYVPLAFLLPAAVAAIDLALARARRVEAALLAAIAAALLGATIVRNAEFAAPERMYRALLARRPANVRARYHLALTLEQAGRADDAFAEFQRAASDEPSCWPCANNLGALLARRGRLAEAEREFARAVALAPEQASFRGNLERALALQGKWVEALAAQRELVKIDGGVPSREALARILATAPDPRARSGEEAVAVAEAAMALARASGGPSLRLLETLAAAYAEAGRWEDAREVATALGRESRRLGREPMARTADAMLARIAAREPWREGGDAAPGR